MDLPVRNHPDHQGTVSAIAAPVHANNDGSTYFAFAVYSAGKETVLYLDLATSGASVAAAAVSAAFSSGYMIQVGVDGKKVAWVQAVARRVETL